MSKSLFASSPNIFLKPKSVNGFINFGWFTDINFILMQIYEEFLIFLHKGHKEFKIFSVRLKWFVSYHKYTKSKKIFNYSNKSFRENPFLSRLSAFNNSLILLLSTNLSKSLASKTEIFSDRIFFDNSEAL